MYKAQWPSVDATLENRLVAHDAVVAQHRQVNALIPHEVFAEIFDSKDQKTLLGLMPAQGQKLSNCPANSWGLAKHAKLQELRTRLTNQ